MQNGTVLVDILNKAAGDNKQGPFNKYDSTYYGGMGYYITAMNGTRQNFTTGYYWFLFDEQSGGALPCGVSSYVPVNQSTTIFRYTTYSNHSDIVTGYCKQFPSSGEVCDLSYFNSLFLILTLKTTVYIQQGQFEEGWLTGCSFFYRRLINTNRGVQVSNWFKKELSKLTINLLK